jgi:hypothetical protein
MQNPEIVIICANDRSVYSHLANLLSYCPCTGPLGSRTWCLPEFVDNRHMNVVRLLALRTGRLYTLKKILGTNFCFRLSRPQGPSAAGSMKSIKKSHRTHRETNPRPSYLKRRGSINCATAYILSTNGQRRLAYIILVGKPI